MLTIAGVSKRLVFSLKNKYDLDAAYFDFAKALDTVCWTRMLLKIAGHGIKGHLSSCITAILI